MLSVLICTYNRAKYIGNLLESIVVNDLPKAEYEIVLVDNNCTDNTREICQSFSRKHEDVLFRYVEEHEQGLSAARNKAIHEARGELLVYIDDDALVDPWYLRTVSEYMAAHPECYACGGPIIPLYETREPEWMTPYTKALLTAWMDYGDKVRPYPKGKYPGGGNAAYRKEVFERVGVFNTALGRKGDSLAGSEEKDIFNKMQQLNMSFVYLPQMVLHHIIPQKKLERAYFDQLTVQIGRSERLRTQAVSRGKYAKRMFAELVKWCGTIVLLCIYSLQGQPVKGTMLVSFRMNVTKGLLGR